MKYCENTPVVYEIKPQLDIEAIRLKRNSSTTVVSKLWEQRLAAESEAQVLEEDSKLIGKDEYLKGIDVRHQS